MNANLPTAAARPPACRPALVVAGLLCAAWPTLTYATNGYFSHGYSASQIALGGAGTANPDDAMTVAQNPAGLAWVGNRTTVGLSVFMPTRDYSASDVGPDSNNGIFQIDPGNQSSKNDIYYLPSVAWSHEIDDVSSWGIAMYGNGGLNTEYMRAASATFARGFVGLEANCMGTFGGGAADGADLLGFCGGANGNAGVDLIQLFVQATYARKLTDAISIGFSPIIVGQRFKAVGLEAFSRFSNQPDKVTGNGLDHSYGGGARVGVLVDLFPGIGFGASYQSRIWTQGFDKYRGLFASNGSFDVPSNWNAGFQFHVAQGHRLLIDFQRIYFSEIDSVGNEFNANDFVNNCAIPRLLGNSDASPACLGAGGGPGFGWRDINVYKIGYQAQLGDLKLRAGYSYTKGPIKPDQLLFNVFATAVPRRHLTGGVSYAMSSKLNLDLGVMYAINHSVTGKNPLSNTDADVVGLVLDGVLGADTLATAFGPDANDQDIRLRLREIQYSLGFSYRF